MNEEFEKAVNARTVADVYVYRRIYEFIADIHAASDKAPPQVIGGAIYTHFKKALDSIEDIIKPYADRDNLPLEIRAQIRTRSRAALDDLCAQYGDSAAAASLNSAEKSYLEYFQNVKVVSLDLMRDIEAGKYTSDAPVGASSNGQHAEQQNLPENPYPNA